MSIPMIVANGSSVIPNASPAASTRLVSFLSAMFNFDSVCYITDWVAPSHNSIVLPYGGSSY